MAVSDAIKWQLTEFNGLEDYLTGFTSCFAVSHGHGWHEDKGANGRLCSFLVFNNMHLVHYIMRILLTDVSSSSYTDD